MNELLELHVDTQTIFNEDENVETAYDLPQSLPVASLPTLLKKGVEVFTTVQEQLLFTYSAIATLSGTMNKITGTYDRNTCYPNLFFMCVAQSAAGKGAMMYAKTLIDPIQQFYISSSAKASYEYKLKCKMGKKKGTSVSTEERPPYRVALIPANCSSSKLMQHLSDNNPDTPSVMIESEIDTMVIANAGDFGNYSDILRKVFRNESISFSRRNNDEYFEIAKPQMSLVLSGTQGQVLKLINNKEDGLFNRFMVMAFNPDPGWRSMAPRPDRKNLSEYFEKESSKYFKLWEFISRQNFEVLLSEAQWESHYQYCKEKYTEIETTEGVAATSIIKRHGLILFKICMVLTGMRKYEMQSELPSLECSSEDFKTALFLTHHSIYSSLKIYELLPDIKMHRSTDNKDFFYSLLPKEFDRAKAILIAKNSQIGARSADRYLTVLVNNKLLYRPTNGNYVKV